MTWKPRKDIPDSHEKLRALMQAAREIFGITGFAAGHIDDQFGGELYYIYRVPRPEKLPSIDQDLARRFKS